MKAITRYQIDRRSLLAAIGASLLAGPLHAQGRNATPQGFAGRVFVNERNGVRIHTYIADPAGAMVTSHIVETNSGLVVIDGQFVPTSARELNTYIASVGKPIARTILSHMHPDHWFGFHYLGSPAVHTGPITAKFLTERGANLIADRKAATSVPPLAGTIEDSEETIGGVAFRFRRVLDTEAPEMVTIEFPAAGILIAQDLIYNKVHAVVNWQIDQWVRALKSLESRGGELAILLAGHGEPASPSSLASLVRYLEAVKPLLEANRGKPGEAKRITEEIAKAFPDYRLPPLLTLGLSRTLPS